MSIKVENTIFLFPVPPHPTSAPYNSLADGMGILPKALNRGWGQLSASLPRGNKTLWVSCGEQREYDWGGKQGGRAFLFCF